MIKNLELEYEDFTTVVEVEGKDAIEEWVIDNTWSMKMKRVLDLVLSTLLIFVLSLTFFPLIALCIALDSRGGVFYRQVRTGKNRVAFTCWKFRTMRPQRGSDDVPDAMRVTRVGRILRPTHLDELPQLINVLKGEMSLVGPRPHMLSDTLKFEGMVKNYHVRHLIKPGITGLAQVRGFYGWVENEEHLRKRVQWDIEYLKTGNIGIDLMIMFKTLLIPIKLKG